MCKGNHSFHKRKSFALLILRFALASVFIAHGWRDIHSMDMLVQFFASLGFASWLAHVVAYGEFIAGVALFFGIFSRLASLFLAVLMAVILLRVKLHMPFIGPLGNELELSLFAMAASIMIMGPGKFALGSRFCRCCKKGGCKSNACPCHAFCDTMDCGKSICTEGLCMSHGSEMACDACDDCKKGCSGHEMKKACDNCDSCTGGCTAHEGK